MCSGKGIKSQWQEESQRQQNLQEAGRPANPEARVEKKQQERHRLNKKEKQTDSSKLSCDLPHVLWVKRPHMCVSTHTHRHTYTIIADKSFSVTERGACVSTLEERRNALKEIFSFSEEWGRGHWEVFI